MSYYNTEEDFLAVYTSCKLKQGGLPVITAEELEEVREKFIRSVYSSDNINSYLQNLNFNNLEEINDKFYKKSSKNRSWQKEGFILSGDKLYVTYDFFDYTDTYYGEFYNFLHSNRYKVIKKVGFNSASSSPTVENIEDAKKIAMHLTNVFMQRYILKEIESGRWPVHMKTTESISKKDLGKVLELKGTKAYFTNFYNSIVQDLAGILSETGGNIAFSDKKAGNLKYNNLKRLLSKCPMFFEFVKDGYNEGESKFDIEVKNGKIKCTQTTLTSTDPYDDFSDAYKTEEVEI